MNNIKSARLILETCLDAVDSTTKDYEFSELRELLTTIEGNLGVYEDYELELAGGEVRVIHEDSIDEIMQDELENDPYILGCFQTYFLEQVTGLDSDLIEAIKAGEQHEKLGQWIIDNNHTKAIQEGYRDVDGYGHHFAHYDSAEHEVSGHYIFRTY